MPTENEMLTAAVKVALTEGHASSPTYDADTLVVMIVTAIDAASLDVTQRQPPEAVAAGETAPAFPGYVAPTEPVTTPAPATTTEPPDDLRDKVKRALGIGQG